MALCYQYIFFIYILRLEIEHKSIIINVFWAIEILILARVFLSWMPLNINYKIKRFIFELNRAPIYAPFRKLIPPTKSGIDFSPVLAFLSLEILKQILVKSFKFIIHAYKKLNIIFNSNLLAFNALDLEIITKKTIKTRSSLHPFK